MVAEPIECLITELEQRFEQQLLRSAAEPQGALGINPEFLRQIISDFKGFAIRNCTSYRNMLVHFPTKKEDLDHRFAERWREELGGSVRGRLPAWVGLAARAYNQRIREELMSLDNWAAAVEAYGFLQLLADTSML